METKDFLRGILKENKPQVVNLQNGSFVQVVNVNAEEAADFINSLSKYERILLKTRINRHSLDAGYLATHVNGMGKQEIQRRILLSEFWKTLLSVATPHFKK